MENKSTLHDQFKQAIITLQIDMVHFVSWNYISHIHEHMILSKSDVFMLIRNNRPSMDKKDNQWSMIMHREGSKLVRIEDDATSEDYSTLKPP